MTEPLSYTTIFKIAWGFIVTALTITATYLNIDAEIFGLYFMLLFIDLFTGTLSAWIRKEEMLLRRFTAGFLTKLLMFIVPVVVAIILKMQCNCAMVLTGVIVTLSVSEAISIFNNVQKAKGKKTLPEFDGLSIVSLNLRNRLEKYLKIGGGE
ncbi:MAG: phage holin family protein [Sulfurovum sp.]